MHLPFRWIICFFFTIYGISVSVTVVAQRLKLSGSEPDMKIFQAHLKHIEQADRGASLVLAKLISSVQKEGYFTARVLSDTLIQDTLFAALNLGEHFEWAYLQPGNLDALAQERSGFREKFFINKPFHYDEVDKLFGKLLKHAENNGHPFATVSFANTAINHHKIHAAVNYQPGPKITFGRLQVAGNAKVKSSFLEAYLGILPKRTYDERKIMQIPEMLMNLPFLSLSAPVEVTFQNETADVILNLSETKSNSADGVINFLPAEGKEGSLLLTGELNIHLNNLWQSGKEFLLRWQRLQIASQRIEMSYRHTRPFRLPVDAAIWFNMLKEDTLFYNRKMAFTLDFPFSNNQLTTTAGWQTSRLLEGITSVENRPADMRGFDLMSISANFTRQKTNQVYYPTGGYTFSLGGETGRKTIQPNVYAASDSVGELPKKTSVGQQAVHISGELYRRIGNNWLFFYKLSGAGLFGKSIFVNDMYRIGGIHSLRGFYDNFFFASQYGLSNLELRLLFEQTKETYSYLFAFYDQAYLRKKTTIIDTRDHPLGLGAGINLSTPAGTFSLVYGLGRSVAQPFNMQYSKVHFGYISRF